MAYTREERCLLWLGQGDMGAPKFLKLLEVYGGACAIWDAFSPAMEKPLGPATFRALSRFHGEGEMDQALGDMWEREIAALFLGGEGYPPLLAAVSCPPPVLYVLGEPGILSGPAIALVGTRSPSRYGRDMAFSLGKGLGSRGVTVVSGFARGIDTAAHEGCLQGNGKTAAVMGCGLDTVYPPENKGLFEKVLQTGGLLLTQHPLGAKPAAYHFPERNRILSGVSHGVVLVEGKLKSGGMITVGHALDQGREVFALPGPADREGSQGPNQLLREGGRAVTCAEDILADMGWELPEAPKLAGPALPDMPGAEQAVSLLKKEDLCFEELFTKLQRPAPELNSLLTILELQGIIKKSAGNLYSLTEARA